jgi:predicted helicase
MSLYAINNYYASLDEAIKYAGSKNETSIKHAFYNLLNEYAIQKELRISQEVSLKTSKGNLIRFDGVVRDSLQNDWGYWESKDEDDDIKEEVKKKFKKGYPNDNIIFEDTKTAILYQSGSKVMQVNMQDEIALDKILTKFISYERPEVKTFREAIEKFKEDIPKVADSIKQIIDGQQKTNKALIKAENEFLEICRTSINEAITKQDVIEMMVQHILSADIFNTIFDEPHFHQENNVARELSKVLSTFFVGELRKKTLAGIKHYYDVINARAAQIADHHEKQKFLKVVYENFYKGYNPKAADKLGIVYTPNEIVRFMIESTDCLLHRHFSKTLSDKGVDIFDPATGTGTFICDLIDHINPKKLKDKYKNELHANEVSILPYYIANLNIEYTYKQKTGEYEEFENLCFADTLDKSSQHLVQVGLFSVSAENTTRIRKQNERKISVIIGNPPYNANQQNENDNNKNRVYDSVDEKIRATFIKNSTAQKTKMYDMYSRFYRWAMDRLNDNGIIAFVTNRSFIDSRTFDGFRKTIQDDFDFAYIIDTKSDVRANPKIAGTTHNVFGIQAGIAVMFLVKTSHKKIKQNPCRIEYVTMEDNWLKQEKLNWFSEHKFYNIDFDNITPDKNNNWLNITNNDWDSLIPVCSKEVKTGKSNEAIFSLFSLGVVTARDEWVYSDSEKELEKKVKFLIDKYNKDVKKLFGKVGNIDIKDNIDYQIKWSRAIKNDLMKGIEYKFDSDNIREVNYRPFRKKLIYFSSQLNEMQYQLRWLFPNAETLNNAISITFHEQTGTAIQASNIV